MKFRADFVTNSSSSSFLMEEGYDEEMLHSHIQKELAEYKEKWDIVSMGGRGDADCHEDFDKILRFCRGNGIVPNYTTSGFRLDERGVELSRRYCGAVAVSWYQGDYTLRAISMLVEAGVKTNLHFVLSSSSVDEAIRRLRERDFPEGINAVIFLLHKPVGLGTREKMLTMDNPKAEEFFKLAVEEKFPFKIGFDTCSVPAILNYTNREKTNDSDTCEGVRWSAYISPDMYMMPCSFDNQERRWAQNLENHTIAEVWDGERFEAFRGLFRDACPDCQNRSECMGGCPIVPECVLCGHKERLWFMESEKSLRQLSIMTKTNPTKPSRGCWYFWISTAC